MKTLTTLMAVTAGLMVAGCSQLPFLSTEVPDVTGFTQVQARQILEADGFDVEGTRDSCFQTKVQNQVPAGGTRQEKGSTVTLAVDCLEPPPSTPWWME